MIAPALQLYKQEKIDEIESSILYKMPQHRNLVNSLVKSSILGFGLSFRIRDPSVLHYLSLICAFFMNEYEENSCYPLILPTIEELTMIEGKRN